MHNDSEGWCTQNVFTPDAQCTRPASAIPACALLASQQTLFLCNAQGNAASRFVEALQGLYDRHVGGPGTAGAGARRLRESLRALRQLLKQGKVGGSV